ncbi:MAG: cytochrome c peroxidase, partial [Myxococcota bacterium]
SAEMLGETFEAGSDGDTVRAHLAARLGGFGVGAGELNPNTNGWAAAFRDVFDPQASETLQELVTPARVHAAIGAYERSMVFVSTPWRAYVQGDEAAISDAAKRGTVAFFNLREQGAVGCANCHSGDLFSDEAHHTVGFPQLDPSQGDGPTGDDDFARERVTGVRTDRYDFRTPSLLNVALTAPYGHSGTYATLTDVLQHCANPSNRANAYAQNSEWCQLAPYAGIADCATLYPNSGPSTASALQMLAQELQQGVSLLAPGPIGPNVATDIVVFLETLTDPCLEAPACYGAWALRMTAVPTGPSLALGSRPHLRRRPRPILRRSMAVPLPGWWSWRTRSSAARLSCAAQQRLSQSRQDALSVEGSDGQCRDKRRQDNQAGAGDRHRGKLQVELLDEDGDPDADHG